MEKAASFNGTVAFGEDNELTFSDTPGSALMLRSTTPGRRGEIQIIPCDANGEKDPFAGGEVTLLMKDTRESGFNENQAFTLRGTRNGTDGDGVGWTFRSLATGSEPVLPIEFDATDGTVQFKLNTNGSAWFYRQVHFQGSGDLPVLRLGPQSQPAIDFEDNDSEASCTYRLRSIGGNFSVYNTTKENVPFELTSAGRPIFRNAATVTAAPNACIDAVTGELKRSDFAAPLVQPALPTDGTATNIATATLINDLRAVMIAYGIAQ